MQESPCWAYWPQAYNDNRPTDNMPTDNMPTMTTGLQWQQAYNDNRPTDNRPTDNRPTDNRPTDNNVICYDYMLTRVTKIKSSTNIDRKSDLPILVGEFWDI